MGFKTIVTGGCVQIEPKPALRRGCLPESWTDRQYDEYVANHYRSECASLRDQIKRHVDDIGSVEIVIQTERVCEHCGSRWAEGADAKHNGGCCEKDEAVMVAEESALGK